MERNVQEVKSSNPVLQGYISKFFDSVKNLNVNQKVDRIYKFFTTKDVPLNLSLDSKLNRILYESEMKDKIKETEDLLSNNKKQFKWPWKIKRELKSSKKARDKILVMFITMTNKIEMPKLYPIYSGNMVIIKGKPYELDPRAVLDLGTNKCMVIKEIDRRPVCNLDWDEIKRRGDSTHSDEFLIKAAMRAYIADKDKKKEMNKWVMIGIGVAIIALVIFFFTAK